MACGYISLLDVDPGGQRFMTLVSAISFGFKTLLSTSQKDMSACVWHSKKGGCIYQHIRMMNALLILSCT